MEGKILDRACTNATISTPDLPTVAPKRLAPTSKVLAAAYVEMVDGEDGRYTTAQVDITSDLFSPSIRPKSFCLQRVLKR